MKNILFILLVVATIVYILYMIKVSILGLRCKTAPQLGQKWIRKEDIENPWFTPVEANLLTITDFKNGWIKFDRYGIKDCALEEDTFVRLYRYVKD